MSGYNAACAVGGEAAEGSGDPSETIGKLVEKVRKLEQSLKEKQAALDESRKEVVILQARHRPWLREYMKGIASAEREQFKTWVAEVSLFSKEEVAAAARQSETPAAAPGALARDLSQAQVPAEAG